MNIIICDDSREFCEELLTHIKRIISKSRYADNEFQYRYFDSPDELLKFLEDNTVDILFLDISMPQISGFDIAKLCQDSYPEICLIFISSYENQVYYSIRFSPFRFLCKSSYQRVLHEALDAALQKVFKDKKYLNISSYKSNFHVKISDIVYISRNKQSNYLTVHCKGADYRVRSTVQLLSDKLSQYGFAQTSSGTLINMKYINSIESRTLLLTTGEELSISRRARQLLIEQYVKYMRAR